MDLYNNTYTSNEALVFYLEAGDNTIVFKNVSAGDLAIKNLEANAPIKMDSYEEYISNYTGEASPVSIFVNATDYVEKNSSYVRLMAYSNPSVAPYDSVYKKLNVQIFATGLRLLASLTYRFM